MQSQINPEPSHLVWHTSQFTTTDRVALLGHSSKTVWLTGLSGSGKSTLAFALERRLVDMGLIANTLDGDNIRHGLCGDFGFSAEHRSENIRRISEVAHLMNDAGLIVISFFISPYRYDREIARSIIGEKNFTEVYVSTPLAACEEGDPKGLYGRAWAGELADFTGISAPYETPEAPALDLDLDNSRTSLDECIEKLLETLGIDRV